MSLASFESVDLYNYIYMCVFRSPGIQASLQQLRETPSPGLHPQRLQEFAGKAFDYRRGPWNGASWPIDTFSI